MEGFHRDIDGAAVGIAVGGGIVDKVEQGSRHIREGGRGEEDVVGNVASVVVVAAGNGREVHHIQVEWDIAMVPAVVVAVAVAAAVVDAAIQVENPVVAAAVVGEMAVDDGRLLAEAEIAIQVDVLAAAVNGVDVPAARVVAAFQNIVPLFSLHPVHVSDSHTLQLVFLVLVAGSLVAAAVEMAILPKMELDHTAVIVYVAVAAGHPNTCFLLLVLLLLPMVAADHIAAWVVVAVAVADVH